MNNNINNTHKNNFKLINEHNLKVGDKFIRGDNSNNVDDGDKIIIRSIHPLYGWVCAYSDNEPDKWAIKQDLSNIDDFNKV